MHYRLRERAIGILMVGCALLLTYGGCSTPEPPQGEPVSFSGTQRQSSGSLGFVAPEGWVEEEPSSSMREAQYKLPGSEPLSGDAELAVFSAIGGTVDQNVQRWLGQFETKEGEKVEERMVGDFKVTMVDVSGTFSGGMGGGSGPADNYRMLAAVIETQTRPWFLKLVGPKDTVAHWEESFGTFVQSVHYEP